MRIVFDLFCALLRRGTFAVCATVTVTVGALLVLGAAPALADSCPNAQFRTGPSADLPDCRAYEQVTPEDKGDQDAGGVGVAGQVAMFPQVAPSGNAIGYTAAGAVFPGAQSGGAIPVYLSEREAGGWATTDLTPPQAQPGSVGTSFVPMAFSSDLSTFAFGSSNPTFTPDSTANQLNGYLMNVGSGSDTLFTPGIPSSPAAYQPGSPPPITVGGASSDFSRVAFDSHYALTGAFPAPAQQEAFEYASGKAVLVSVLPDGTVATNPLGAGIGSYDPNSGLSGEGTVQGAVSSDGSRVYWTDNTGGETNAGALTGGVYLSTLGPADTVSSVQINASQASTPDPNGTKPAEFLGATPDGSVALITSAGKLTNDATTGATDGGNDLYEYNANTGKLTDISVDSSSSDANGAQVQGVVGFSNDGSRVYFVADGVLASGAKAGEPNLYLWDDGSTTFVATLSAADTSTWQAGNASVQHGPKTARLTADGSVLAFQSTAQLTSFNNNDQSEIYRYGASTGSLTCVSCDPSVQQPSSGAVFDSFDPGEYFYALYMPGNLSSDGSRIFFQDAEPLLPQAPAGETSVYEWEASGTGSCATASGCLFLISGGSDSGYFLDASPSGSDVFFLTRSQLAPADADDLLDVYDARIDGGFPAPASTAAPCVSSSQCEGSPGAVPSVPSAGSVSFTGPANPAASPSATTASKHTGRVSVTKRLIRKAIRGTAFSLTVKVPGRGRITVTGALVKRLAKNVAKSGGVRLMIHLTGAAARRLRQEQARIKRAKRRGRKSKSAAAQMKVRAKVSYKPATGSASSVTVAVTVKA